MNRLCYILIAGATMMFWASPVLGWPLQVYCVDPNNNQDPLAIPEDVHEVGDAPPFPPGEIILSLWWAYTEETACDGPPHDDPDIPNVVVCIQRIDIRVDPNDPNDPNLPVPVWYVADPQTTLTNYDGFIGNLGLGDAQEAFRIDHVGMNQPLIFESMAWDNLLEPGEIWEFIIQDYQNALGGPPIPFDSIGIASLSSWWPPSTGSLLGAPEEEPVPPVIGAKSPSGLRGSTNAKNDKAIRPGVPASATGP